MHPFPLQILTPEGTAFDGRAEALTLRTVSGQMGILAGHTDCMAPLAQGNVTVRADGAVRRGSCDGGILTVLQGKVTLLSASFRWNEEDS